ncbi:MAG: ParB/RepB/Spo0J family partition protein [Patescibacteria group bacterium]
MIMGRQSGLGRGLGAIIPPKTAPIKSAVDSFKDEPEFQPNSLKNIASSLLDENRVHELLIDLVDPNPHQPREHFDYSGIEELVTSIREHGVMQPVIVTVKTNGRFELIAGERRLRASKIAGLTTIPALIRSATEQQKFELAIIENIQRQDLNPIEEAKAYLRLQNEFNLTQDEISDRVGKSRPQVANIIRLLQLPAEIQDAIKQGRISQSHARTLLSLGSDSERRSLFENMLEGNFTVRQAEARIPHRHSRRSLSADPNVVQAEQELRDALGTKVIVKRDAGGEGEVRIVFLNDEDFESIKKKIIGS